MSSQPFASKVFRIKCRAAAKLLRATTLGMALTFSTGVFAGFACSGSIASMGVDQSGNLLVALQGVTPIHAICSTVTQGSFGLPVQSCKLAYASILSARLTGRSITIYYGDNNFNCGTLPSWGQAPSTYFVQGPD